MVSVCRSLVGQHIAGHDHGTPLGEHRPSITGIACEEANSSGLGRRGAALFRQRARRGTRSLAPPALPLVGGVGRENLRPGLTSCRVSSFALAASIDPTRLITMCLSPALLVSRWGEPSQGIPTVRSGGVLGPVTSLWGAGTLVSPSLRA